MEYLLLETFKPQAFEEVVVVPKTYLSQARIHSKRGKKMGRKCNQCGLRLPKNCYSSNQWRKGANSGRCRDCVLDGVDNNSSPRGPNLTKDNDDDDDDEYYDDYSIQELLDMEEMMNELRGMCVTTDKDGTNKASSKSAIDRVENLRLSIGTMEALSVESLENDQLEDFLRARKLLGQYKKERERMLEERRVQKVVEDWERTAPNNRNVDDENTECPYCHKYLPLNGTTREPDGTPIHQKRLFCCGTRACKKCEFFVMMFGGNPICPCCSEDVRGWKEGDRYECDRWLRHAHAGKAWAQCHVGGMYLFGKGGLSKDVTKALEWYNRAAEKGYVDAFCFLSQFYLLGDGVPKNRETASKWMRRAAECGDREAQLSVVKMGGIDSCTAVRYLTLAAAQGDKEAQYLLGDYIESGHAESVENPTYRSLYWYEKAAKCGHKRAQYQLAATLIKIGYDCFDAISIPAYSPLPVALYWARLACCDENTPEDWLELRDCLVAAVMGSCAMCDKEIRIRIHCQCCDAAYYCSFQCQKMHTELGHEKDCKKCIVFNPCDKIIITGLKSASHLNGSVGCIKHYDEKKGRYAITVMQCKDILVKPENMHLSEESHT